MRFSMFPYERRALEGARDRFSLPPDLLLAMAKTLEDLRDTFEQLTRPESGAFRQGQVAVMGLINHTQHLFVGGISAIVDGNAHVWSACLRGLIETFGACVIIGDSPGTAPNFLGSNIKAGKLRSAAERAQPGLGADLDRLSAIVHPASGAIHAGFSVADHENRIAIFQYGYKEPCSEDGTEAITALTNTTIITTERLMALAASQQVLSTGSVIMERAPEFDTGAGV